MTGFIRKAAQALTLMGLLLTLAACGQSSSPATATARAPDGNVKADCPPVLNGDGTVTFRYCLPATSVSWTGNNMSQAMTLDPVAGVWSTTVALRNNHYEYVLTVDGVANQHDPSNLPWTPAASGSQFFVPGSNSPADTTEYYPWLSPYNDVPRGTLQRHWLHTPSSTGAYKDGNHPLTVYTPAGYKTSKRKYPVLYLVHGGGGNDVDWSTTGAAATIADNLIAEGRAEPMIIAMPNFYRLGGCGDIPEERQQTFSCEDPTMRQEEPFRVEMLRSFIPFVEDNYRVIKGRAGRAYAGLSQGGAYGNWIMINSADAFAYFGIWSPACIFFPFVDCGRSPNTVELLGAAQQGITAVHLASGYADTFAAEVTIAQMEAHLTAAGIAHRRHLTPTDVWPPPPQDDWVGLSVHSWQVWREALRDALETTFFKFVPVPDDAAPGLE